MGDCMVKTHLSLTDNPTIKGVPKGWRLRIRDILTYKGAGFVVPVAGAITLMPGTASDPAYRRVGRGRGDRQGQGRIADFPSNGPYRSTGAGLFRSRW